MNESFLKQIKLRLTELWETSPGVWRGFNKGSDYLIELVPQFFSSRDCSLFVSVAKRENDLADGKTFLIAGAGTMAEVLARLGWEVEYFVPISF